MKIAEIGFFLKKSDRLLQRVATSYSKLQVVTKKFNIGTTLKVAEDVFFLKETVITRCNELKCCNRTLKNLTWALV